MRPHRPLLAVLTIALAACSTTPPPAFLVVDAGRVRDVVSDPPPAPLAAGENIRATPRLAAEHASVALVQIGDRETPHVHSRYDLTVVLARGQGTLWLAGTPTPMRAGDAAFIARGTPHWFVNDGDTPAAAVVVYAPPFSGPDTVPVP
jgi:quercetin dioxygenase-like cupin family protein